MMLRKFFAQILNLWSDQQNATTNNADVISQKPAAEYADCSARRSDNFGKEAWCILNANTEQYTLYSTTAPNLGPPLSMAACALHMRECWY